jgi:hypothetical protein
MTVIIPRQGQEQHKLSVCCCDIPTSNDERESDALSSDLIIVRQIEREPQMTTTVYTVFYCWSFIQHKLNEEYSEVSTYEKGQQIQMILENLPTQCKNRLPLCISKLNDQRDMLLYIPPAYHVYFNSLNDSGSMINGHTAQFIQREYAAYCCKIKDFQLYE